MNQIEKGLLTQALERIRAQNYDEPTFVSDASNDNSLEADLRSLNHQGYLLALRESDTDAGGWTWIWDAGEVLAWEKSQQMGYRVVGLRWENCHTSLQKPKDLPCFLAETIAGKYLVEQCQATDLVVKWRWVTPLNHARTCDSLEHGKQLCEEHWLDTLLDGGVIEAVKND